MNTKGETATPLVIHVNALSHDTLPTGTGCNVCLDLEEDSQSTSLALKASMDHGCIICSILYHTIRGFALSLSGQRYRDLVLDFKLDYEVRIGLTDTHVELINGAGSEMGLEISSSIELYAAAGMLYYRSILIKYTI